MRQIIINTAVLWVAVGMTLSPQQFEVLKTAEKQWGQGRFTEVSETLAPHRDPETDEALQEQVERFLTSQSSERAVMAALMIDDQSLRNQVLFRILNQQLYASYYMPEKFDRMLGKAEMTAQFLTGTLRDDGYANIACEYFRTGKYGLAWEAIKKIDAERYFAGPSNLFMMIRFPGTNEIMLDNANRLRTLINTIQSPSTKATALMRLVASYTERTDEKNALLSSLGMYSTRTTVVPETLALEFREKRQEILKEATQLLLSLPDSADKVRQLQQARVFYLADAREAEAKVLYPVIQTIIENIQDASQRFRLYAELFRPELQGAAELLEKMQTLAEQTDQKDSWRTLFQSYSSFHHPDQTEGLAVLEQMEDILDRLEKYPMEKGFGDHQFITNSRLSLSLSYLRLYHLGQPDAADILEKIQANVRKIDDPFYQMVAMFLHWEHYALRFSAVPQRREAFDQLLKALTGANDVGGQRMMRLEWMIGNANEEEMDRLADAIQELLVSRNLSELERRQADNLIEQIVGKRVEQ